MRGVYCFSRPVQETRGNILEQANIVGEVAQVAKQAIIPAAIVVPVVLVPVLKIVQEHLTTDDRRGPAKRAHSHVASASLEEAAESPLLLALHGGDAGCGNNAGQAGAATGAVRCANGRHCHANGTAQHHWLLPKHGLLIAALRVLILLLGRIGGRVLGLPIRLLGIRL